MNKLTLLFSVFALVLSMSLTSCKNDSIEGTWKVTQTQNQNGDQVTIDANVTYASGGTITYDGTVKIVSNNGQGVSATIDLKLNATGTYTKTDKTVTENITNVNLSVQNVTNSLNDPQINAMLSANASQLIGQLKQEMQKSETYQIASIDSKSMTVNSEGQTIVYTRQ